MRVLTRSPGDFLRPRAAGGTRAHPSSDGSEGGGPLHPRIPFVQTAALDFGELLLPAYPSCGDVMLTLIFQIFSQTPNRRRRARGPLGEISEGGGVLHPARADWENDKVRLAALHETPTSSAKPNR